MIIKRDSINLSGSCRFKPNLGPCKMQRWELLHHNSECILWLLREEWSFWEGTFIWQVYWIWLGFMSLHLLLNTIQWSVQLPITTCLMLRWPRGPWGPGLSSPSAATAAVVFDAATASGMAQDLVGLTRCYTRTVEARAALWWRSTLNMTETKKVDFLWFYSYWKLRFDLPWPNIWVSRGKKNP